MQQNERYMKVASHFCTDAYYCVIVGNCAKRCSFFEKPIFKRNKAFQTRSDISVTLTFCSLMGTVCLYQDSTFTEEFSHSASISA